MNMVKAVSKVLTQRRTINKDIKKKLIEVLNTKHLLFIKIQHNTCFIFI